MFENLKCTVCDEEDESQKHILHCKEIRNMKENNEKELKYANIFGENVIKQREIAKCFEENLKIKKHLEKNSLDKKML